MKYKFSRESLTKICSCAGELQSLLHYAISHKDCPFDFTVLCGFRGEKEQNKAYEDGKSKLKYPKSKHNSIPALAVDIAPYPVNWNDLEKFKILTDHIKKCAKEMGIIINCGIDWKNFVDAPHIELKEL